MERKNNKIATMAITNKSQITIFKGLGVFSKPAKSFGITHVNSIFN
jgi:hypothetical protein